MNWWLFLDPKLYCSYFSLSVIWFQPWLFGLPGLCFGCELARFPWAAVWAHCETAGIPSFMKSGHSSFPGLKPEIFVPLPYFLGVRWIVCMLTLPFSPLHMNLIRVLSGPSIYTFESIPLLFPSLLCLLYWCSWKWSYTSTGMAFPNCQNGNICCSVALKGSKDFWHLNFILP